MTWNRSRLGAATSSIESVIFLRVACDIGTNPLSGLGPVRELPLPPGLLLRNTAIMAKSIPVIRKKRGRPATGTDPIVTARFPPGLIEQVEAWANYQKIGRSEAIRRLVEMGLAVQPKRKPTGKK